VLALKFMRGRERDSSWDEDHSKTVTGECEASHSIIFINDQSELERSVRFSSDGFRAILSLCSACRVGERRDLADR